MHVYHPFDIYIYIYIHTHTYIYISMYDKRSIDTNVNLNDLH